MTVPADIIERRIYLIRRQRVMLDSDLAEIYQVTTGNLNVAVRRNVSRFPKDFMFQLTRAEADSLLLQFARARRDEAAGRICHMASRSSVWPCSPPCSTANGPYR
jgi:hypothetical protein